MPKGRKSGGFTMIELLVAIGIFGIFITIVTGVFARFMMVERHGIAQGQLISDLQSVMQSFTKEARTAFGSTYNVTNTGKEIAFRNQEGECISYRVDNGVFQRAAVENVNGECLVDSMNSSQYSPLTGSQTNITEIRFNIIIAEPSVDNALGNQGVITMSITAQSKSSDILPIKLETTVVSRQMSPYGTDGFVIPNPNPDPIPNPDPNPDPNPGFSCGSQVIDSRDNQTYATVAIGSQCWMAKNLNAGLKTLGKLPQGKDCNSIHKYCYDNNDANCDSYGGLYQWDQAMCGSLAAGAQGICPAGWHIPTHDEFTVLERAVCTSGTCTTDFPFDISTMGSRGTNEGTSLKSGGASGFAALLAGQRSNDGSFGFLGLYASFLSSAQSGDYAWRRYLYVADTRAGRDLVGKGNGFSVRCLKDQL